MDIISARDKSSELSIVGIDTDQSPSITTFPRTFSREGFSLWKAILEEDDPKRLRPRGSQDLWYFFVQRYLRLCRVNGIFPFARSTQQSNNEVVEAYLRSSRYRIKTFFDKHEFFSKLRIHSVRRDYEFKHSSTKLTSTATLRPNLDPTFTAWLCSHPSPNFVVDSSATGLFSKKLHANTHLHYRKKNRMGLPELSLSIFCHTPIAVTYHDKLPTVSKLRQLADAQIWVPMVRAIAFKDAGSKLF